MIWRLDPRRPGIDTDSIRCPECGQTYTTIIDGWTSMPPRHYPTPTRTRQRPMPVVGITSVGKSDDSGLCPVTGDDLVAHGFRAQVAAELAERESAA